MDIDNKSPEILYDILNKYLQPNETQKKKNGEVFTPLNLVTEMLNKLPEEVWSNKNLKWLDPCVGIGNFPIIIYKKLMKGLETEIPDEKERSSHILENMIYATDICPINISIYKVILNVKNVFVSDFLNPETFKDQTFDIIVGNPPYQEIGLNGKSKHGKINLHTEFTKKSLTKLNKEGFLCFITPPSWFSPSSEVLGEIKKYQILFMNINECKKYFKNIGSDFCIFIIHKIQHYKETCIISKIKDNIYNFSCDLSGYNYIPKNISPLTLKLNSLIIKSLNGFKRKDVNIIFQETGKYKYILSNKNCKFSDIKHEYHDEDKVLFFRSKYIKPMISEKYSGIGDNIHCKITNNKKESDDILNLLKSKLYTFFFENNCFSKYHNGNIINRIRLDIMFSSDEKLYELFELTKEEINIIETTTRI